MTVDGKEAERSDLRSWSQQFATSSSGEASLRWATPLSSRLLQLEQLLALAALVVLAWRRGNLPTPARRRRVEVPEEPIVVLAGEPAALADWSGRPSEFPPEEADDDPTDWESYVPVLVEPDGDEPATLENEAVGDLSGGDEAGGTGAGADEAGGDEAGGTGAGADEAGGEAAGEPAGDEPGDAGPAPGGGRTVKATRVLAVIVVLGAVAALVAWWPGRDEPVDEVVLRAPVAAAIEGASASWYCAARDIGVEQFTHAVLITSVDDEESTVRLQPFGETAAGPSTELTVPPRAARRSTWRHSAGPGSR